jgi:CBS-domain-containing membrane protein
MASESIPSGNKPFMAPADISVGDIFEAMKDIPGYLDITPGDLKEVFRFAYKHALERISGAVKARDIMTADVHTVLQDTPLKEVARLMADRRISGVPVLAPAKTVIGIISEKDFLSRMGAPDGVHVMSIIAECLKGKGCLAAPIRQTTAGDIMTSPAVTVPEETPLFRIMELFAEKDINRVPVVDSLNVLRGIISRADIIRAPVPRGGTVSGS